MYFLKTSGGCMILVRNNFLNAVRNHVKLLHVCKSRRGFSKGTVLCGGYYLWAWQISWALQTCIAERSKVPNG